jgi:hypothetical protein
MRVLAVVIAAVVLAGCAAIRPTPWVLWRETFMVNATGKYVIPGTAAAPLKTFGSLWACAHDADRSTFAATGFMPEPPVTITPRPAVPDRRRLAGGLRAQRRTG